MRDAVFCVAAALRARGCRKWACRAMRVCDEVGLGGRCSHWQFQVGRCSKSGVSALPARKMVVVVVMVVAVVTRTWAQELRRPQEPTAA